MMRQCEACGNNYDKTFEIRIANQVHVFDSFECAIHVLAPKCKHCEMSIIGHGVEWSNNTYCCASCARKEGISGLIDRELASLDQKSETGIVHA